MCSKVVIWQLLKSNILKSPKNYGRYFKSWIALECIWISIYVTWINYFKVPLLLSKYLTCGKFYLGSS